jgi:RNA polymerase sigma factor (sigma-70 family)
MASTPAHPTLRFIRRITLANGQTADADLLKRFIASREEAAFAELVRRHGPTVLGVCVRLLGDTPDAEDAFQATFLVLARRASSVARPELLANWLYGVARRTALKARADAASRRRHEERAARPEPAADLAEEVLWRDLRPVLEDELSRLPARYRVPLVLCHIDGQTHEEVARRLGCPRETITTRLVRARARLRSRLVRRGVALSAGALAVLLSADKLSAAVPAGLEDGTVRSALGFAAGRGAAAGVASSRVVALAEGVLKAMWMIKLKVVTALLVAVGIVAGGAGILVRPTTAAEPGQQAGEGPKKPADKEPGAPKGGGEKAPAHSVKTMPPVVVRTVPQAGATEVDAATTTEIRVTFSKDMADGSWSWSQISNDSFPQMTGKPHYEKDRRTCVLPVKLEPGKTYVIWLNPPKFQGFRDTDSRPAVFYPLVFETKP